MIPVIIFNVVLLGACLYAFGAGGAPERVTALTFAGAAAASYVAPYDHFRSVETILLAVDVVTLIALTAIALRANRYWPLYVSALQLLTVAIHGVKAYQPELAHWMYSGASERLAYPTLVLLMIGTVRHRRRIAASGIDRDWSPL